MAEKVKARLEALRTQLDEANERASVNEEKVKAADARADEVSSDNAGCAKQRHVMWPSLGCCPKALAFLARVVGWFLPRAIPRHVAGCAIHTPQSTW